ncbi:hypothetical protein PMZ80_006331 [Knufia obscura]|uniref:SH3 domain-containing protein n=2 Tax=Knufia TaxID=430999 RepID=A0AAN8I8X6_9EURO|nr:hypothetical protein PMZ80_006331 [Knufia obscura]KAK5953525.1 hypothetical protein OHC33_005469 [Knufia fluminis]
MSQLPPRFPCWCRAVYSWGGETDKDLGFVEGDLIECLNAGDGSWWMGRLRRDRRMMGVFPSNFVQLLQEDYVPISRSVSPMPARADSDRKNSIENLERKKEQAKKRKPFQGYKTAVGPGAAARTSATPQKPTTPLANAITPPYNPANPPSTVLWQQQRAPRPARSPSPLPPDELGSPPPPAPPPHRSGFTNNHISRAHSPAPQAYDMNGQISRAHSPMPQSYDMNGQISRAHSPAPQAYDMNDRYPVSRTPSPNVASMQGHTPPMIRDAMEDVMSSLEGMSVQQPQAHERQPSNPWSPEAFNDFRSPDSQTRPGPRPLTSLGLGAGGSNFGSTYSEEAREKYSSRHNSPDRYIDGPPHLETYVQRMERQLEERARFREESEERGMPPPPPPKNSNWTPSGVGRRLSMRRRKSQYDMTGLDRTYTTKTNSTNSSSGVNSLMSYQSDVSTRTNQSVFSGYSAGGFSATSAGSLARKRNGINDVVMPPPARPLTSSGLRNERPKTPQTGHSYHSSQDSRAGATSAVGFENRFDNRPMSAAGSNPFSPTPKAKKTGLFKKFNETVKTSFASARSTIAPNGSDSQSSSPTKHAYNNGVTSIAGGMASPQKHMRPKSAVSSAYYGNDAAREMGLDTGAGADWLRTRRDLNRSNTPGPTERRERADRCQMLNEPVICPVDELYETVQGDEDADGRPVYDPFVLNNPSFSQVDKAARFITSLPSSITAASLATGYVCRPYRSDVQRLRAIFIWCAERITWSEEIETPYGSRGTHIDTRRTILQRSGSSQEVAAVVTEMCRAIGLDATMIQGYLKRPGEPLDLDAATPNKANHYWNSVLVDNEWRIIDASLASPTNPHRGLYSSVSTSIAEPFYFLTKPSEICWTHVPVDSTHQHLVPPVSPDTLLALPGSCPPFFRQGLMLHAYDTSQTSMDALEMSTIAINTPLDTELYAEVEAQTYRTDYDGDTYEDPDAKTTMRVLSQPSWYRTSPSGHSETMQKRYIIKALLPGDERTGVLKIYAGKKGLMHSAKEIVHPLALAIPLRHSGENPQYEFARRHPTPHATRQDLYVIQPQCLYLGMGERYVFYVRQHSAHVSGTPTTEQSGFDFSGSNRPTSPNPLVRPSSALSMSSSIVGSAYSDPSTSASNNNNTVGNGVKTKEKPAKLAIQSPSGKIFRMTRKVDGWGQSSAARQMDGEVMGSVWETVGGIKVGERGVWRGLVLADRSARWCVWGEWECS